MKLLTQIILAVAVWIYVNPASAQTTIIFDDFESYTAGNLLAANSDLWTTWSGGVDGEDAPVSNAYAYSGSNSVRIQGTVGPTDLILPFPSDYTSGAFEFSFKMYIVGGNGGYFNIQQSSTPGAGWMFEAYFDSNGGGYIYAAGNTPVISYNPDSWNDLKLAVDLTSDYAEFYMNDVFVYSWQWSLGSSGYPTVAQIGGVDFFAYTPDGSNCDYYIDDVQLLQSVTPTITVDELVESACVTSIVEVPFTTAFDFNLGNIFTAQLINENGDFSSPIDIGSVEAITSGVISAIIPDGIPTSNNYKIRVVSSDPDTIGSFRSIIIHDSTLYYADADGDGYGDINSSVVDCNQPSGYVSNADDCNDSDWSINPGAYDYDGNGIDNNCDGCIDGNGQTMWPDADGDGYGDASASSLTICDGNTQGYSWNNLDCNDADPNIYPYISDWDTDGIDNNCDGCVDGYQYWLYPDEDGDGWGVNSGDPILGCYGPSGSSVPGYSPNTGDCDDSNPSINPGAYDYNDGNGIDNNCDGCIDGYVSNVFVDADSDGYGAGNQVQICGNIAGYSYYNGDCNDADASIYPGANELTNGIDDNCDGQADEIQVCTPSIQWDQSLGGTSYDEAKSIAESGDGGYVVAGYSYSYDGDVTCQGYWGWVTKVDKDGNIVWQTCVSGYSYSIALTSDNGFIVAGEYNGNFSLAKIDADGNLLWQQQYGGSNYDVGRAVSATDDGGCVAAGYIYSNDGDVSGFHGAADIWVIKVNNSGDLVWQKCLGGSGDEYALSVSRTLNGGFLVTGYTTSGDGDVADFNGYYDGWILELDDSSGELLWEDAIGTSGYESLDAGIQTSDGGYALIGYVGNGNFSKLDNDRNFQWTIWLPNGANEVVQAADGGYAVSGTGWYVPHSSQDAWAAKLKSTGELQWSKYFGGTDFDYADDILQADDGGYIVAGINNSNDGDVSDGIGNGDYWLVKLSEDPPSGLQTYYADADGDGYGNSTDSISDISCIAPPGYSYYNTDCNDAESSIHPNAFEDCLNGIDDDCNGVIDDGTGDTPFYADVDGDGFGNVNAVVYDCSPPDGYVSNKDDCNDGNAAVHPGADEVCNGIDDNCNNEVDEGYTLYTFFADADGDTYGNHSVYIVSCYNVAPDGYVTDDSDCDDENAAVNPGATEIQNGIDDDCDGAVDEGFCSVPTGLFNDAITTTSAHLHWTEPLNAKRYKIQYMPADGSTPPVNLTVLAPASYVNITGLSTFTLYKWRMKTRCNDGSSSVWTETVGFKTAPFKEGALEKSPAFDVKLYPNPTSGWVNVEVNAVTEQSVVIKFYDIVGKEVYSEEVGLQSGIFSRQIDLSFLSSGTYFLKVIHDGSNEVRKLVMEK